MNEYNINDFLTTKKLDMWDAIESILKLNDDRVEPYVYTFLCPFRDMFKDGLESKED